jgi:hypothetical protein
MSYCGACGGFYHPGCPHARQRGGCTPAPNPFEERNANLLALAVATYGHLCGMESANTVRQIGGLGPAYVEDDFAETVRPLIDAIGRPA